MSRKIAVEIYEKIKDMDFMDYESDYEKDIIYIENLLKTHTKKEVLEILN